ncbi:MAG: HepT-like ribonuclease domain-containing protein [Candidatus Hodarchaeales archaeon]|jgi:uncharacterized protein with HEPN domain
MNSEDDLRIKDIEKAIIKIRLYCDNKTKDEFMNNELLQDAIIRNFEIIGEAVYNLSNDFKKKINYEWEALSDFGDILLKRYFEVNLEVVWDSIYKDLPELSKKINSN